MFSHLKRRIGVLTAVAVLAALVPTLSISPAGAAPNSSLGLLAVAPQDGHTYNACPSTATIPSAGFTDTTSTDVDCIAMYGITTGVTATTYEPSANIPRWQMALYLTRMASTAGITLGSGADQGFTDISGYSADIQTAINQIKQLGVTNGTTATTYSPDDNVTNEQMAMFVERTLAVTTVGVGGSAGVAAAATKINARPATTNAASAQYNYTDIDSGNVTFEGHNAVIELYHLGIAGHAKTVTTFSPSAAITRGDMATWMTNALDHTNARPTGATLQASQYSGFGALTPSLHVSYRDASQDPVAGVVVDVFEYVNTTVPENPNYTTASACGGTVATTGNSLTKCKIDVGDSVTDASGNLATIPESVAATKTNSYVAWTAASSTIYNDVTHGSATDTSKADIVSTYAISRLTLTSTANTTGDEMSNAGADNGTTNGTGYTPVRFGTDTVITAQLDGGSALIPSALADTLVTCTQTTSSDADAATLSVSSTLLYTDATGKVTFTVSQADPAPLTAVAGDAINHVVVCASAALTAPYAATNPTETSGTASTATSGKFAVGGTLNLRYTDVARVAKLVSTTNSARYGLAGSASAPVTRTATATIYDQYGAGLAGDTLVFGGSVSAVTDVATNNEWDVDGDPIVGVTVRFTNLSADAATCVTEGALYYVKVATPSRTQFATGSATGTTVACAAAKVTTGNAVTITASGMSASRVSDSNGLASVSWSDTGATAVADGVVTEADSATGGQQTYYRVLKPSGVAAVAAASGGFNPAALASADADSGDDVQHAAVVFKTVYVDIANQTIVIEADYDLGSDANAAVEQPATTWMRYVYDDNDQFSCDGVLCTFATWEGSTSGLASTGWADVVGDDAKGLLDGTIYNTTELTSNVNVFKWVA